MYKLLLILFVGFLSAQKTCRLSFSSSPLSQDGKIVFTIRNMAEKKIKIPKEYNYYQATPIELQIYNEDKKNYENSGYSFDDVLCGTVKECFGKMIYLKKNELKMYEVNIIPGRISKAFKERKRYRFKLAFDTYLFSGCHSFVTDWVYYQN